MGLQTEGGFVAAVAVPLALLVYMPIGGIQYAHTLYILSLLILSFSITIIALPFSWLRGSKKNIRQTLGNLSFLRKEIALLLICISVGTLLGVRINAAIAADTPSSGLPKHSITTITGVLTEDGIRTSTGKNLYLVRLIGVEDRWGTSASAYGKIVLLGSQNRLLQWGTGITVPVVSMDENRDDEWFFVQNGALEVLKEKSSRLLQLRSLVMDKLLHRIESLGDTWVPMFKALFLGIREDLGIREIHFFRTSGNMHLLALSGMHLGILTSIIAFLLLPLVGKKIGFFSGLLIIACYLCIVGPRPSLLRAALMYGLFGFGIIYGLRTNGPAILLFSFIVLAVCFPDSAHSLSFKLSFLALFGILTVGNGIARSVVRYVPSFIGLPICCSMGAQLATAALIIHNFGVLYPAGILSSLVLAPLVTVFMWSGIVVLLLPFGAYISAGSWWLEELHSVILSTAGTFSRFPAINIVPEYRTIGVAIALFLFAGTLVVLQARRRGRCGL